jgi:hypothetical protein
VVIEDFQKFGQGHDEERRRQHGRKLSAFSEDAFVLGDEEGAPGLGSFGYVGRISGMSTKFSIPLKDRADALPVSCLR